MMGRDPVTWPYEEFLLERLVGLYEASGLARGARTRGRLIIRPENEKRIKGWMEDAGEKKIFFRTLESLRGEGILDYEWMPREVGNLIQEIWLERPEQEKVLLAYGRLGRTPKGMVLDALRERLAKLRDRVPGEELSAYLGEAAERIAAARKFPAGFSEDVEKNEELLRFLECLDTLPPQIQERVLSTRLYGDSKHFVRHVRKRACGLLRRALAAEEDVTDEELLSRFGITRFPEVMEFAGDVSVTLRDGAVLDFAAHRFGAYINADAVEQIDRVTLRGVSRILFVENKANYCQALAERAPGELVVWHGGVCSPMRARWFSALMAGARALDPVPEVRHWSDIDLGGFGIFVQLKRLIPEAEPFRMDEETLLACRGRAMEIGGADYRKRLEKRLLDPEYAVFHGVIRRMLAEGIRLEQENLIDSGEAT